MIIYKSDKILFGGFTSRWVCDCVARAYAPTPMNIFRATERLRERGPITIRPNQESQKAYSTEVHMGKQEHFIHGEDSARGGQEIMFTPLQEPAQTHWAH